MFAKDVPDPENFGVVVYDGDGSVTDVVEKAGCVDMRYAARPRPTRSWASTAIRRTCSTSSTALEPSSRGELEITDVNRVYAQRGRLVVERVEGWWHDGGKHWADLAEVGRLIDETGVNK